MNRSALLAKEEFLDRLQEDFCRNVNLFTERVKESMQDDDPDNTKLFDQTVNFLTQDFPDVPESETWCEGLRDEIKQLKADLAASSSTVASLQCQLRGVTCKVRQLSRSQDTTKRKIVRSKTKTDMIQTCVQSHMDDVNEKIKVIEKHFKGLRKLQQLLQTKSQISQASEASASGCQTSLIATQSSTAPLVSASKYGTSARAIHLGSTQRALSLRHSKPLSSSPSRQDAALLSPPPSSPLKHNAAFAPLHWNRPHRTSSVAIASSSGRRALSRAPRSLSENTSFSVMCEVHDVKLLSSDLAVVAAKTNSLQLWSTSGQLMCSLQFEGQPCRLAVIDPGSSHIWKVAFTKLHCRTVTVIEATLSRMRELYTIELPHMCWAIAATEKCKLAVGYCLHEGIDLIDTLTGSVLHQLDVTWSPQHMTLTPDHCLLMSTWDEKVARMGVRDGKVLFCRKVPQLKQPFGVASFQDGHCVIIDKRTSTLHLVNPDGSWDRELWRHTAVGSARDALKYLCVNEDTCLACTSSGTICVLDLK